MFYSTASSSAAGDLWSCHHSVSNIPCPASLVSSALFDSCCFPLPCVSSAPLSIALCVCLVCVGVWVNLGAALLASSSITLSAISSSPLPVCSPASHQFINSIPLLFTTTAFRQLIACHNLLLVSPQPPPHYLLNYLF